MVFLALLAIAIGVLLSLALVLVGLVEAPWPVLLVGLLVAFYGLQRLLGESQAEEGLGEIELSQPSPKPRVKSPVPDAETETAISPDDQVLTYRGIRYRVTKPQGHEIPEHTPLVEGTYRGHHWQHGGAANGGHGKSPSPIPQKLPIGGIR
jgi:hypothetical protein